MYHAIGTDECCPALHPTSCCKFPSCKWLNEGAACYYYQNAVMKIARPSRPAQAQVKLKDEMMVHVGLAYCSLAAMILHGGLWQAAFDVACLFSVSTAIAWYLVGPIS